MVKYYLQNRLSGERDWSTTVGTVFNDLTKAREYRDRMIETYPMVDFRLISREV